MVAVNPASALDLDLPPVFLSHARLSCNQLGIIDRVTKFLKTKNTSLSDCRLSIDTLLGFINSRRNNLNSPLDDRRFEFKYVSPSSNIVKYKSFATGIVRIQRNLTNNLTRAEKAACKKLLISSTDSTSDDEQNNDAEIEHVVMKRLKTNEGNYSLAEGKSI